MSSEDSTFSEKQTKILERFVTNTEGDIFCLRNLPEVLKGALFSRYSRSSLGLRSLLLKEFIANDEETAFSKIVQGVESKDDGDDEEDQLLAIQRAQKFYDRILDGYGDDSIGELGGAHLAIENVSMLAAKVVEDCRIGGSPLEKSTRYIYFDQKVNDEYLYYREPVLMTSAYRELYLNTCDKLFDTYSSLIPPLTELIEKDFPHEEGMSKVAYRAALRAKVLDCLRGLLPAGTLTNMGVYGNGRFFEQLIHKLQCNNLAELQDLGRSAYEELSKVIPSFVRRSEPHHRHHVSYVEHFESLHSDLKLVADKHNDSVSRNLEPGTRLVDYQPDEVYRVAAGLLYPYTDKGMEELLSYCRSLPGEELEKILDAACGTRENRRHKSPRALENAFFTFEVVADYGIYRDLQRHRMNTQDRQLLGCDYGYYIPDEIRGTEMEGAYCEAMEEAAIAFNTIAQELPEEAQYIVPMAYNIRWYYHINLRALQWLCELRSGAAGHTNYRRVAQDMARQVCDAVPAYERFFKFVDYEGYELGRLGQEQRSAEKKQQFTS